MEHQELEARTVLDRSSSRLRRQKTLCSPVRIGVGGHSHSQCHDRIQGMRLLKLDFTGITRAGLNYCSSLSYMSCLMRGSNNSMMGHGEMKSCTFNFNPLVILSFESAFFAFSAAGARCCLLGQLAASRPGLPFPRPAVPSPSTPAVVCARACIAVAVARPVYIHETNPKSATITYDPAYRCAP